MKSQFRALLLDAVEAKRHGALSGTASNEVSHPEGAESTGKAFSLLIRNGEIVGGEYAGRSGLAAILQLLDASTILKVRWFQMQERSISASEPLIAAAQLEFLIGGSSPATLADGASKTAKSARLDLVERHAVEVFRRLFGDSAEARVNRITSDLGPAAKAADVAQACVTAVEPLLGADMARSYFKEFL